MAPGARHRIGVVFTAGLILDDPDRDHLAEMFTAIGDGRAVAACIDTDTDTDTSGTV